MLISSSSTSFTKSPTATCIGQHYHFVTSTHTLLTPQPCPADILQWPKLLANQHNNNIVTNQPLRNSTSSTNQHLHIQTTSLHYINILTSSSTTSSTHIIINPHHQPTSSTHIPNSLDSKSCSFLLIFISTYLTCAQQQPSYNSNIINLHYQLTSSTHTINSHQSKSCSSLIATLTRLTCAQQQHVAQA